MARLTKQQKYERRLHDYSEAVQRISRREYGAYIDPSGNWHWSFRGYPQGYPWTKAYGDKRKRRR